MARRRCYKLLLWTILLIRLSESAAERAYPNGCAGKDPSYYDYESMPFPPPWVFVKTVDDYLLTRRLGTGKFSDVFEAVSSSDDDAICVIKCLKPVSERKIRREVLVLQRCSGLPNLARLEAIVIRAQKNLLPNEIPNMPSLVLTHAGRNSQWLCHHGSADDNDDLTDYEIRYYLMHLLVALDGLHSLGIMHRDVKPRNVLIDRDSSSSSNALTLIDLGLADFYLPETAYNVRVASRHYKSPELLIGYEYYDYAIDMWGVGCILAGLLLRREPFFRGKDNVDQLGKIIAVLGTKDLLAFLKKYKVTNITPEIEQEIVKYHSISKRQSLLNKFRPPTPDDEAGPLSPNTVLPGRDDGMDLLDKLLVYDHEMRLTAQQAMQHPFFDLVRERVQAETQFFYQQQQQQQQQHQQTNNTS